MITSCNNDEVKKQRFYVAQVDINTYYIDVLDRNTLCIYSAILQSKYVYSDIFNISGYLHDKVNLRYILG